MEIEHQGAIRAAVETLDSLGVQYFLFGANAQNVWGDPRFTTDADFILILQDARFEALLQALSSRGFRVELERHLNRIRTARLVKLAHDRVSVDFVLGETEFDRSALARRKRVDYLETPLYVGSPEDIILYKLIAHRHKDLSDIEGIMRRQGETLDRAYLGKWAKWLAHETDEKRIETTLREMLAPYEKRSRPNRPPRDS